MSPPAFRHQSIPTPVDSASGGLTRADGMLYMIQHSIGGHVLTVRLNITLDDGLYARLKKATPPKKMSAFIAEAVEYKLRPGKADLNRAYKAAARESWRKRVSEDWGRTEAEAWPE